jgi:cephalosporin hydroxylase
MTTESWEPSGTGEVTDAFHRLYYGLAADGGTWNDTYWMGIPTEKCPLDLWVYQEILHEIRPDVVIETGTRWGGSALFLACMMDLLGHGQVVTIDIDVPGDRPRHPRISYLLGSSTSPSIVDAVTSRVTSTSTVMTVLDSDHSTDHVLRELRAYGPLVTKGSYLVVEDTNINGHPVLPGWGPGPREAVDRFLTETQDFTIDTSREKFLLTFNPSGFLKRTT